MTRFRPCLWHGSLAQALAIHTCGIGLHLVGGCAPKPLLLTIVPISFIFVFFSFPYFSYLYFLYSFTSSENFKKTYLSKMRFKAFNLAKLNLFFYPYLYF